MKNQDRVFESKIKGAPIGIKFDAKEVDTHSYHLTIKNVGKKYFLEANYYLSKELAEKYHAQLGFALQELDKQKDLGIW